MALPAMRALKIALETRTFDRAYLFHGDDDYLKEEKIRALIEAATEASTRDFNVDMRRGGEVDPRDLAQVLGSPPMMADRRVLVIREASLLKKDARAALLDYLGHPSSDIVLVLAVPSGSKSDDKLSAATSVVEFKRLNEGDLAKWASARAAGMGAAISPGALSLLCAATGNDLALIAGELEKLWSYTNRKEITERAVSDVVGVQHGETTADLLDAVAERDGIRAFDLVERVLSQPKTTAVSLLMALTTQTLAIGWALAARAAGTAQHHMESELFGLLKENPSSLVGRPWGEGVKTWIRAMPRWDSVSVDHALDLLAAADVTFKETKISSEEQVLKTLVLAMGASTPKRQVA